MLPEEIVDVVDIAVIVIGIITVSLLVLLLVLMRTVYAVVRRERPTAAGPGEDTG